MGKKWVVLSMVLVLLWCGASERAYAEPQGGDERLKAAFIREGNLWVKQGAVERKLTTDGHAERPKWSFDGAYIAYTEGRGELRVYSFSSNRFFTVHPEGGQHYEWSPNQSTLAFQLDTVLNTAGVRPQGAEPFVNVSLGVGNYTWLPNGRGFLVSSDAKQQPTGWTGVTLFLVPADAKGDQARIRKLYTLPAQSDDFFAVHTSTFKWSADGRWIAFLGMPTASLSADSNTLCLLRSDGSGFQQVDHMLRYEDWFQWLRSSVSWDTFRVKDALR
ncbi:TolB family protein [Paenibacillus cremeus]|nr:PD40 domain-containing protein [Paenibacillus cremeus]